jgi:hypothetical protein
MDFKALVENFLFHGTVLSVSKFGNILINDSCCIITGHPNSVLQRVNHHVFTDIDLPQTNIFKTLEHILAQLVAADERNIDRKVLNMLVEVCEFDVPAQEVKPTVAPQEDEFAIEVDGHQRVALSTWAGSCRVRMQLVRKCSSGS